MGYTEEGLMHTWYEETAENVERWLEGREILNPINQIGPYIHINPFVMLANYEIVNHNVRISDAEKKKPKI